MAVVDKVADKKGNRKLAEAYLKFLYTAGPDHRGAELLPPARRQDRRAIRRPVPKVKLFTLKDTFGDWRGAQRKHFADGGVFDQLIAKK